ncbi:Siderophore iron transporter [Venturia nashicola]|nr:Siderophore iron transporter [Venturia nashicola]
MAADTNNPQCKEWLARLYQSGQYTDLTIICDGHTFNVHKSVICMQSSFFEKACKKNAFMEGETGVVDLPGDDPAAVKAMLESFYLSSYSYDPKHPQWSLHTKVAALADKYDIKPLRSLAQELLGKAKHEVPNYEVEFATAIQWTYENTASDDQTRRTLVQMAVDDLNHLLKNESFSNIVAQAGPYCMLRIALKIVRVAIPAGGPDGIGCAFTSGIAATVITSLARVITMKLLREMSGHVQDAEDKASRIPK